MNIIVVGCGKVGLTLADQLNKEGHKVTIIDNDEKALRHAVESIDVMGVQGNGAMLQTQNDADVRNADVLIAATNSDEVNMLCCLIAKKRETAVRSPASATRSTPARSPICAMS